MQPFKTVVGIDVAQDSLAVSIYNGKSHEVLEFDYTQTAIRKNLLNRFKKEKESVVFVMEATGIYHTQLAYMLCENTFKVSVLNPFVIKKYAEMNLMRVKTDSVDAKLIAQYGYEYQHKLLFYKLKNDARVHVDNIIKAIDDLLQQKTMSKNQHHALKKQAHHSKDILSSYDRHIKFIGKEIIKLEKLLEGLLNESFAEEYKLLRSIPGIGLKTSSMIIAIFDSFKAFENPKQACSFAGIAPNPYQSGTSVKGRGRISKRGNPLARKILYMGALSATIHNPMIRSQYKRLIENGKPKMVAMIAAANKLLRQAFGVLKSGIPFDTEYMKVCKIMV